MSEDESWVDITTCFKEACVSLAEGELFSDDKFGLVEAMTAIEIMDPKMDSTAALFSLGRDILSFEQAIKSGAVKIEDFEVEELVGIIDETTATLVTWLDGQNILQTVFTNLYLHDHTKIRDQGLQIFVVLVLKFVGWVIQHTNMSRVCYEEDFVSVHQLTFNLASELSDSDAINRAKEVEQLLLEKAESTPNIKMVINRIASYRILLHCLTTSGNYSSISQYERDAEWLTKSFVTLKQLLESVKSTVDFGCKPVDTNDDSNSATRFDYPTIMGFDPLANQHLLPPTLPRAPLIKTRRESVLFLIKLVDDIQLLFTQPDLRYDPWDFLDFLVSFTSRAPNVLVRLIGRDLLTNIINNAGETVAPTAGNQVNEAAGIVPHMCQVFLNCSDFSQKSLQQMSAEARANVQVFLTNLTCTLISYIQLHYLNLSRQRDKIGKLLDQMCMITDQAETVDSLLANSAAAMQHSSPAAEKPRLELLTTYLTTCMQMRYVLLGFQLGIYSAHEYRYVFAGLAEHFLRYYVAFVENAHAIVMMTVSSTSTKSSKNKSKSKQASTASAPPPAAVHLEELMRLAQTYYSLCMAYFFLSHGLILDSRLPTPKTSKYDDEGRRYFYRFSPFAGVSRPPYFSYEMYHRVFEQIFRECSFPAKCYQQAQLFFNHARRGLESLSNGQLKWQTLFAFPTPLPRPANPVLPIITTIKRTQIVLNILMSELPPSSQLSMEEKSTCHDSCCSGHRCSTSEVKKMPVIVPPPKTTEPPVAPVAEVAVDATSANSTTKRTKVALVFTNSIDFPSLEVVKNA